VKKWLLLAIVLVAVGGGFYYWWTSGGVQVLHEKALTFAEVRRTNIRDIISATGLVEPREIVFVSSETPGTVLRLQGRVGDTVLEGAELAQLDDRRTSLKVEEANNGIKLADAAILQAQAALAQANAQKDAAEKYWNMQKDLAKAGGPGFRAEREQAEAQYYTAIAGIKLATAGIEAAQAKKLAALTASREAELVHKLTRIKVPDLYRDVTQPKHREFLILERKAHEGQMVGPQSGPLFTLAGNLDRVEVHAQVAEGDVNKIKPALKALFKVANYDDQDIDFDDGVVKEIRPLASNIKGAVYYDAVISIKNRKDPKTGEWQLRPGMTVSLDIVRYEHAKAWRVPVGALNFKLEEAYQDATAKSRLAEWNKRADAADWRAVWVWDASAQRPRPVFVRIGAKAGEIALKDAEGNEILEWEPGQEPTGPLRVITGAPPARPPSFLDQPANIKL
jgi:multidrug efflux pump subunit AcrA (membrane-fusion protein)